MKNKLTRKILGLALALLMVLPFSSCGKKIKGVDPVEPGSSDSPTDWQAICQG